MINEFKYVQTWKIWLSPLVCHFAVPLNAQGHIFYLWRHEKKDKVQMPQWHEMLGIYCIFLGFMSLKLFKTIFSCFYIIVEGKVKLIWINSPHQKYINKRNEKSNVLVFENSLSVYMIECC